MRCFVAVDVPSDVQAAIAAVQAQLRAAAPRADVRWADPRQLHLTLEFLGAVPDERVPAVADALETAVAGTPPIALAAAGLGAFPNRRNARVLWVGIAAGGPELARLAAVIDRALARLGMAPENRPFDGHVTIGRVRSPRGGRALAAASAGELGAWTASEVVLYRSDLRPTGAVHTPISRHPLRGVRA